MAKLKFQIVTPQRTVLHQEVDSLTCPTQMGQITVLPNHIPLIAALQAGELIARVGGISKHIAVSGGFVEVRLGNEIVILADTAERAEEIDPARAEEARRRAEEDMKNATVRSSEEFALLAAALQKNLVRLRVSKKRHVPKHYSVGLEETVNLDDKLDIK